MESRLGWESWRGRKSNGGAGDSGFLHTHTIRAAGTRNHVDPAGCMLQNEERDMAGDMVVAKGLDEGKNKGKIGG